MAQIRLLPRDERFFVLFEQAAERAVEAADVLQQVLADTESKIRYRDAMRDIEHAADKVNHEAMEKLNSTFVTPLDPEDIRVIANHLDDIIDSMQAAVERIVLYDVVHPHAAACELSAVLAQAVREVQMMVVRLRDLRQRDEIKAHCIEINRLENAGDAIYREALGALFQAEDMRELFRWKEILERIERGINQCEDLADSIFLTIVKHS